MSLRDAAWPFIIQLVTIFFYEFLPFLIAEDSTIKCSLSLKPVLYCFFFHSQTPVVTYAFTDEKIMASVTIQWSPFVVSAFYELSWSTPLITCHWKVIKLSKFEWKIRITIWITCGDYVETAITVTLSCSSFFFFLDQFIRPLILLCQCIKITFWLHQQWWKVKHL